MSGDPLFPVAVPVAVSLGGALGVFVHGMLSPGSRMFGPIIVRGPREEPRRVALTFDDGPSVEGTGPTLDALAAMRCPGTFFFIGRNVEQQPALVKRAVAEGHQIENHSFDHSRRGLWRRCWYWEDQLRRADAAVAAAGGPQRSAFFRPPMGFKSWRMAAAATKTGHHMVTWSLRGMDGVPTTSEAILKRIVPRAAGGDIIALHDGSEPGQERNPAATIAAIPELIRGLRNKGLELVRLDELLKEPVKASDGRAPARARAGGRA